MVDGSAALGWTFEDEQTPKLLALLTRVAREGARSTSLFPLETANVVLLAARRGRISDAQARTYLTGLSQLDFDLDATAGAHVIGAVYDLAARHQLTFYDAAYMELAVRLGAPLATLDQDLAAAAVAEGIELIDLA